MSELAQRGGSKRRKEILRNRKEDDVNDDTVDRIEPPESDRSVDQRLFWLNTAMGPWVMAWDYTQNQWQTHGEEMLITPEQAAENGWEYLGPANFSLTNE